MAFILIGHSFIGAPDGVNLMDMENIKVNMHLFKPIHFLFPFVADAAGTLIGCFIAVKITATHQAKFVWLIALFFFVGGIVNVFQIPGQTWFNAVDLTITYLPMGLIAVKWTKNKD
jgi:hypothetical protein